MEIAARPPQEPQRLDVLRGLNILDTEPEPAFDAMARLAVQQVGCPIGLVSLIDADRQWFKGAVGLDARETSRDVAFCAHAILQDEVFVVEDAASDPRFADNPLVTGPPHIRFYAGAPLTVAGHNLGTLCAIDRTPRHLGEGERTVLRELALVTSGLLEARLREQRLFERLVAERAASDGAAHAAASPRAGVFDAVSARMAILDRRGCIVETNAAWQDFAGAGRGERGRFVGARYLDVLAGLKDVAIETVDAVNCGLASVVEGRASGFELEYRCGAADEPAGEPDGDRWFTLRIAPVGDEHRRLLVSHEDITRHKRAQAALLRLAHTDALTGVANRRRFFELAHHEFERSIRYHTPLTVLMADIDHFKRVNDRHGHAAGDLVLRSFVRSAREALRDADLIGRLGGEEFAVLLPHTTLEGGHALAQRIVERVAATLVPVASGSIGYTVSLGVSALDARVATFDELLRAADTELYRAKDGGRNTVSSQLGDLV